MSKTVPDAELERIEEVIARYPTGIRLDALLEVNELAFARRTLQRRIKELIARGRLTVSGKGAATHYWSSMTTSRPVALTSALYGNFEIPITPESLQIRQEVTQPLHERKQKKIFNKGCNPAFLDDYQPNESAYLSETIKIHLRKIGQHSFSERIFGTYAKKILERLLVDLSWNSSRLEGNTYSLLETKRLIELGETPENKSQKDAQMILNHKASIEFLVQSAEDIDFNRFTILNLHALLSDNLLLPAACGRLRTIPVEIGLSIYIPSSVPQIIDEFFEKILEKAIEIQDPFEQAFFMLVQLPYLQPFEDVNKRVSRLAANIPFIRNNLSPISFVDVPEKAYIDGLLGIYELNRVELLRDIFIWAYERSAAQYTTAQQQLGEPDPFRLQYREALIELVGTVVRGDLSTKESIASIQTWVEQRIPVPDRARFREIVETELMNLHIGNIARFQLRPSEFQRWHQRQKIKRTKKE